MLKEIIIAFQSYVKAHHFITKHKLWKWILIPGIFYTILLCFGMYFFLGISGDAIAWLSHFVGIDRFLHHRQSAALSFLFIMGGSMVHVVLVFFFFSLFKYLFLIISSPLFAYLSQQTEALITGKDFEFQLNADLWADLRRANRLALRNAFWQSVYIVCILILAFIPLIGWITPVIAIFVECYYYGFSMCDYSGQRHNLPAAASIAYISNHKGLAIGNGMVFYGMHFVPIIGWVFAPAYAVIAATISLYHQNLE